MRKITERAGGGNSQAILDAAPDAMVGVDSQGAIVMVNIQAEVLFGYERLDLIGKSVELLVPDQQRATHTSHREGYLAWVCPRFG